MKRLFLSVIFILGFGLFFGTNVYLSLAAEESVIEVVEGEEEQAREGQTQSLAEDKEAESVETRLKWEGGIDVFYDSNVFNYSNDDIDEYNGGTNPDRFKGVDSIDDMITRLYLMVRFQKEMFADSPTIFSLGVKGNIYARNTDKSYQIFQTSLRQKIGERRLIRIGYKFIPDYFVRTLYDPDLPAGDRFRKANFRSNSAHIKYWHRVSNNLTWWLRYVYEDKDYTDYFKERDSSSNRVTLALGFRPQSWIKLNPFFRYFWHDAKGEDDDAAVDVDISRDGFDTGLNTWFYPEGKFSYLISYAFRYTDYTTSNSITDDPYHAGRDQKRHRIKGRINYGIKENVDLFTEYTYEIRNVDIEGDDATLRQESILGYVKHIGKVGLTVRF